MYPHERSLVKRLADKPFVLLAVNSDEDRNEVKKVMQKNQLSWRSWWDGGSTGGPIQTAYNVEHWPTIYVLDGEGVIRYIDPDENALDEGIDKLLAEIEKKGNDK